MGQRRHHYERAFERLLRRRRIPYVCVDEARKTLAPAEGRGGVASLGGAGSRWVPVERGGGVVALKSFDYVVYGAEENLLVDVKGRRARRGGGLQSWVTREDIDSLRAWCGLFGEGFGGAFAFLFWRDEQPADGAEGEVFEEGGRWYELRMAGLDEYAARARARSPRWQTVHVGARAFARMGSGFRLCSGTA